MIEIITHASGSAGNAYSIIDGNARILVDPGIPFRQLQKATGFNLSRYDFALVSHEHKDHCHAVKDLMRIGIPVAMSQGTMAAFNPNGSLYTIIKSECMWELAGWQVLPFQTEHDAAEPLGFLIESPGGSKIIYATDTKYIRYKFSGITHFMIECNYSEELLLKNNGLDESTKMRIRQSHFEFENVQEFFRVQDLARAKAIHLIHLSEKNSDEKLFTEVVQGLTGVPVFVD